MESELEEVYAEVPKIECKGLCQHSCVSDVRMSEAEMRKIVLAVGFRPEAVSGTRCPVLDPAGSCSAYSVRPLICRLWGVVAGMRCPHGCKAERILTDEEARALVGRVGEISMREVAA